MTNQTAPPPALLLMTSSCPHCPGVLQNLGQLLKEGALSRLEAINLDHAPHSAGQYGVRSVPWLRLGDFEFEGSLTLSELREWAAATASAQGRARYLGHLLRHGQRQRALERIRRKPEDVDALLSLLEDPQTDMGIRLGADAIVEDLAGSAALASQLERLAQLSRHGEARLRLDACHYLGLTGRQEALPHLQARLDDADAQVREAAAEALAALKA